MRRLGDKQVRIPVAELRVSGTNNGAQRMANAALKLLRAAESEHVRANV